MLTAQYVAGKGIEVAAERSVPPGPGEVQIAVAFTGICGTDLHIVHGAMDGRTGPRRVIGHEMSGVVEAVGPGVADWTPGDHVTVMPLLWCGECPTCVAGNRHICDRLVFVGIDAPGSLQNLWTVPEHTLVRLPGDLSLRSAALVEPVAVAHHDVSRGGVTAGERAVVVGGGPVGLLIAVVAASRGADVVVLEVDEFRRGVIGGLGLATIDPLAAGADEELLNWSGGVGADVSFEVSGTRPGLTTALSALRARGRLVAVGIHPEPRLLDLKLVFWKELQILGARVYERADYDAAIELLSADSIPADALISAVVPLRSAPEAFQTLNAGGTVMKVLIDCTDGGE